MVKTLTASTPLSSLATNRHGQPSITEGNENNDKVSVAERKCNSSSAYSVAHSSNSNTRLKDSGLKSFGKCTQDSISAEMSSLSAVLQSQGELSCDRKSQNISRNVSQRSESVHGIELVSDVRSCLMFHISNIHRKAKHSSKVNYRTIILWKYPDPHTNKL